MSGSEKKLVGFLYAGGVVSVLHFGSRHKWEQQMAGN